jgi:hypothetical protein
MSLSPLISPFAEKFLLPGKRAPRASGWNGRLRNCFELNSNGWRYQFRNAIGPLSRPSPVRVRHFTLCIERQSS